MDIPNSPDLIRKDGAPVFFDQGIRRTVHFFRNAGFRTVDSGDGVSKAHIGGIGGALDYPHVFIACQPHELISEVNRAIQALKDSGITLSNGPTSQEEADLLGVGFEGFDEGLVSGDVSGVYNGGCLAVIQVTGVNDEAFERVCDDE